MKLKQSVCAIVMLACLVVFGLFVVSASAEVSVASEQELVAALGGNDKDIVITQSISVGNITIPSGYTVSLTIGQAPIDTAVLTIQGTLTNNGKLSGWIENYGTLKNIGGISGVANYGHLENNGSVRTNMPNRGTIYNHNGGDIRINGNEEEGNITNYGVMGFSNNAGTVSNYGTINITFAKNSGILTNHSLLYIESSDNSGTITNYGTMDISRYLFNIGTINNNGAMSGVSPITQPSEPLIIKSTTTGQSTTLTWNPPLSDGGAPIAGYVVSVNKPPSFPDNYGFSDTQSSHTFDNIPIDKSTTLYVAAYVDLFYFSGSGADWRLGAVASITISPQDNTIPTSISIPSRLSMGINAQASISANILPPEADQSVTWNSDNPAVATIDNNGVIVAVSEGTAIITATSVANPALSAMCVVTISTSNTGVSPTAITLTPNTATLKPNEQTMLTAQVFPPEANQAVVWTSDNPAIASVDGNGLLTGVLEGTATITATSVANPALSASCVVTVSVSNGGTFPSTPASITVMPKTYKLTVNAQAPLKASILPVEADQEVVWSSDNPLVATIDPTTGLVTAISKGTAILTATSVANPLLSDACVVTVISSNGVDTLDDGAPKYERHVPDFQKGTITNCNEWVNVRSGPGTEYGTSGKAYLNESIELIEWDKTGEWCKVYYNGGNNIGWIHGKFIKGN